MAIFSILLFFFYSSLFISNAANVDRTFFLNNILCQQRIRSQCASHCLSHLPTDTCSGSCGGIFGGSASFTCSDVQPSATNTLATTTSTTTSTSTTSTVELAPDGSSIRNDPASEFECKTVSGAQAGASCVFPFKARGVEYTRCTYAFGYPQPWCSTKVDGNGDTVLGNWGNCPTNEPLNCPLGPKDGTPE